MNGKPIRRRTWVHFLFCALGLTLLLTWKDVASSFADGRGMVRLRGNPTASDFTFVRLNPDCVSSLNPTSQSFLARGGSGIVNVTAAQGCNWTASSTASFITITSGTSGSGSGSVDFSVSPNNGPERSGSIVIDQRVFNITQAQGGSCAPMPITVGQTVNDSLTTGSCPLGDGSSYDAYSFSALAGQQISILMTASFNTYLFLLSPDGSILAQDDDGGGGTNARIPSGSGLLTLPTAGTYTIRARSFSSGPYSLTLDGASLADLSVSKSAANDRVAPGSRVVYLVTVTNNAGTAASSVSVTDDLPAAVTFVSCGATDGICGGTGNSRTITFPSLAVGASAMTVLIATVNSSVTPDTIISNTATVSSSAPDPDPNNNTATATVTVKTTQFASRANGRIAFAFDPITGTQPRGLYTINPDGTSESLLSRMEPFASAAAWSPDGTRIAYGKRNHAGLFEDEVRVANPDGTGVFRVVGNVFDRNSRIAWSPNGTKLAFIGTGGFIHIVNADGTGLAKVPNSPTFINDLSWSPDGAMFAYSNGVDVFVMNVDGTGQTNLTQRRPNISGEPATSMLPRWSPDGTRLVFGAASTNHRRLYVMNPDGTGLAQPFSTEAQEPGWSPDGNKFTFQLLSSIYVSNLDGAALRQITRSGSFKPDWQSVAPSVAQLSAAAYPVTEGTPGVSVIVTRTGGSSGAATVDYATGDAAGTNNCNLSNGFASSRCDYLTTIGTLYFAVNETSKTITVPIVDDSYAEGSESFTFTLSNPFGATLASPASSTITIADNDATDGTNPIDTSGFFVRLHYVDFLNREPDAAGLAFWSDQISSCGTDTACVELRRINVSAAFFLSIEFQQTGYLVYRMYKAAYGNLPDGPVPVRLNEFLADTQQIGLGVVVGQTGWEQLLENNKQTFATDFAARPRFTTAYPTTLTPQQFVDALYRNADVMPSAVERLAAIDEFRLTHPSEVAARGRVLRRVAENQRFAQQEFNKAFVLMQYFGYLRRDPNAAPEASLDFQGYNFWLGKLNQFNGNFVNAEMVKAFILSGEYRQRFGR